MTYYDKVNDILINYLEIPNLCSISLNYLFIHNNKYICTRNKKQKQPNYFNKCVYKLPEEFFETSFANEFYICSSIEQKKDLDNNIWGCIESFLIPYKRNKYDNLENEYTDWFLNNNELKSFLLCNDYYSDIYDWCLFLKYNGADHSLYWFINVCTCCKQYGNIVCWSNKKIHTYKNIMEFECKFYDSLNDILGNHFYIKFEN